MKRDEINRAAKLYKVEGEGETPAVEVGGVLVSVYVSREGHLVVAIAGDGIEEPGLSHDDGLPNLRIVVNEARVYDDTEVSRREGKAFSPCALDMKPEPAKVARLVQVTHELDSMPPA